MHSVKTLLQNPLARGMIAYSVLWPTGSLIQQTIAGQRPGNYDWKKAIRFSVYGSLVVAPTLYGWVRFVGQVFPSTTVRSALFKACVEQVTYFPAATSLFFFGMTMLETNDLTLAKKEVSDKFLATQKICLCYWPFIQTFNFAVVPERHRIVLLSCCSLLWTVLLAYMKQLEHDKQMALMLSSQSPQATIHANPPPNTNRIASTSHHQVRSSILSEKL